MLFQVSLFFIQKVAKGQAKVVVANIANGRDYRLFVTQWCSPNMESNSLLPVHMCVEGTYETFAFKSTTMCILNICGVQNEMCDESQRWIQSQHASVRNFGVLVFVSFIRHFTSTLVVTSHTIDACSMFALPRISALHVLAWLHLRSWRKGVRCNVTTKVLVKCHGGNADF